MSDTSADALPAPVAPLLRVVRGEPTAVELAALVAVVTARASSGEAPAPVLRPLWNDPAARLRRPLPHGPGAWRASGLPG